MQKYIGDIITQQRHDTRNTDVEAHSSDVLLNYNQYAQNRLYGSISLQYNYAFEESQDVNITANEDTYTVNDNVAFGSRIVSVWYSPSGAESAFRPLRPTPNRPDRLSIGTRPIFYRRRGNKVIVEPTPTVTQGKLRIVYERALDQLALRRGRVNGTPSGAVIDLTHSSGAPTTDDEALFVENSYVCISDPFGTPLLYNGVISSYNAANDELTLKANVSTYLVSGYAPSDLADGYLTLGKYTTTHSKLPDEAEGYLIEWVNRKLHAVDSSNQFADTDQMLKEIESTIVASYRRPDKDVKLFPTHDFSLLIPEYD